MLFKYLPILGWMNLLFALNCVLLSACSPISTSQVDSEGIQGSERAALSSAINAYSGHGRMAVGDEPPFPKLVVVDTPEVRRFIRYYMTTRRKFVEQTLVRKNAYGRIIAPILNDYRLPQELISVAMVESGLKPNARSHRGAYGVWQFIPRTARSYGLVVSRGRDDRGDVRKSSDAAARHLIDLYSDFNDWYLAMAAYNGGAARIKRAMKRAGSRDFFEVARSGVLRKETSEYVPKVLALSLIIRAPERYGFEKHGDLSQ